MDKEQAKGTESAPKPPLAGVIYGRICYWVVMLGILVAVVGMIMYFVSDGYVDKDCLLDALWDGEEVESIWGNCTAAEEGAEGHGLEAVSGSSEHSEAVPEGHWYLKVLDKGDGVAMMGIAITAFAAVIGMWGAVWGTWRSGERLFLLFAFIVAVILTLSAIGVISLE
jgi:hypothetical protein